jgi:hypothetical protein
VLPFGGGDAAGEAPHCQQVKKKKPLTTRTSRTFYLKNALLFVWFVSFVVNSSSSFFIGTRGLKTPPLCGVTDMQRLRVWGLQATRY